MLRYSFRACHSVGESILIEGGSPLASNKYYSPRLHRDLISPLYHAAKSRRVPMTRLASALVRDGLSRLGGSEDRESAVVREESPAPNSGGTGH
jgi:hypothetical protein